MNGASAFALRRLRRSRRSGELRILALALVLAVAAASAVSLFTGRVRQAIENQSAETLGADLLFTSRAPLPAAFESAVRASGAQVIPLTQFPSVALHGETSALASIKAVAPGYPLRGVLQLAEEPFGTTTAQQAVPARGEAWVDLRLWQELGLSLGAEVQAGAARFRVSRLVVQEPDRGGGFMDLAPRLMIHAEDLPATQLLGEGSRVQYALMAAGTPEQLGVLQALPLPEKVRLNTPRDGRPEVTRALDRSGQFLDLAILAVTLLAAAAVALCARQHGLRQRDEVALLKCLGASRAYIARGLLLHLLLIAVLAGVLGAALGYGAQALIARLLEDVMQVSLPPAPLWPLLSAFVLGLVMLLGFAAPPLMQTLGVSPVRVFQRDAGPAPGARAVQAAALIAGAALLWAQTGTPKLALSVLLGASLALGTLAGLAWLLVRALQPLRQRGGTAWKFGLANIARRQNSTVAQVAALGLALLALLLVSVVRQDLLLGWQSRLGPQTPNQFLINIQPQQVEPLRAFFAARGYENLPLWPMARARLIALNGEPVTADSFDDPETQRWINRDFNLSWTDTLGADNRITDGTWWGEAGRGQPLLSVDDYAVKRLNLKLGHTLTLDFAGTPVTLTVHSVRKIDWDSFKPNFFLVTPPGVLEERVSAQWLTSFYLPPERRAVLRELITEFPNITALDLDAIMNQVRGIMDRIVRAVEFIFLFTLAAGLTVLLAAIEGTREERERETGLLRTLGARSGVIRAGVLAEYATLGLLAGLVAAVAAQLLAWVLAVFVLEIPYGPRPLLWLVGAGVGAGLVTLLGGLSLRRTLRTPPRVVLQG